MTKPERTIRILIADDHPIFRDGLRKLLEADPELEVIGEAGDGVAAVQLTEELRPDILLLDVVMPRMAGIETLRQLANAASPVRTILLTAAIDKSEIVTALQLGARGVVMKDSATQLLYKCIRSVMAGEYWVGRESVSDLVENLRERTGPPDRSAVRKSLLTPRETEIVSAIVEGATNRDIAKKFGLSEQTVKNHLSSIFDKLGVANRLELALLAVNQRILESPPTRR